jgi:hypothetical protein
MLFRITALFTLAQSNKEFTLGIIQLFYKEPSFKKEQSLPLTVLSHQEESLNNAKYGLEIQLNMSEKQRNNKDL